LTDERKEFYKGLFEGVFYRRNILGEWVSAEGAIYDMFDARINYNGFECKCVDGKMVGAPYSKYDDMYCCIDYGTGSVTTAAIWAVKKHKKENNEYHCLTEWYYDVREEMKRMTDATMVHHLYKFTKPYRKKIVAYFVDPSAASLIEEMVSYEVVEDGELVIPFEMTFRAPNDVLLGINRISVLLQEHKMKFNITTCKHSIDEYQGYVWDVNNEDKPHKVDDHTCDRDRYGILGYEMWGFADESDSFSIGKGDGRILGAKIYV
jgi:hypothetical protein